MMIKTGGNNETPRTPVATKPVLMTIFENNETPQTPVVTKPIQMTIFDDDYSSDDNDA